MEPAAEDVPDAPVPAHLLKPAATQQDDDGAKETVESPPEAAAELPSQSPAAPDTVSGSEDDNSKQEPSSFASMPTIALLAPAPGGACQVCLSSSKVGTSPQTTQRHHAWKVGPWLKLSVHWNKNGRRDSKAAAAHAHAFPFGR